MFCCLFIVMNWFEIEISDGHFRHILLYCFQIGKNAVQARKKLYDVYGKKSFIERQCQNWFASFRSKDFDLKDAPRFGRPTKVVGDKIKAMIENNRRSTTREILNKIQLTKWISISDPLLKCNETDPFSKRIITDDEKWVVYENIVRKRSWSKRDESAQSTSKADIHQKKVILSVWWDFKGIVYFKLLIFHHNNGRPHTVCSTKKGTRLFGKFWRKPHFYFLAQQCA